MRVTHDITSGIDQMTRDIKRAIKVVIGITLVAIALYIAVARNQREPQRAIIHLRGHDPLEVQTELARWANQQGIQKASSKRQPDGTTQIVLVAGK